MFNQDNVRQLTDATVYAADGNKIGRVGQVYLDDQTNEPTWVTVSTGWFGTSETFVPLEGATQDDNGDLRLSYNEQVIKDAPRVDQDGHLDEAQQDELYAYYQGNGYSRSGYYDTTTTDRTDVRDRDVVVDRDREGFVGDDQAAVRVNEEQLHVGTERVEAGRVRLRKYVTTEEQTVTVPVQKEHLTVERVPVDGDTRATGDIIGDGEDVQEVVLHEERPVVAKETHAVEEVRIGKTVETGEQQVTDTVRKEHVDVDGDTDIVDGDARFADGTRRDGANGEDLIDRDRDLDLTDRDNDGRRIERERD